MRFIRSPKSIVITSYLGRNTKAVQELIEFCENMAIPVVEQIPTFVNFPRDHTLHLGYDPNPFIPKQISLSPLIRMFLGCYTSAAKGRMQSLLIDLDPIKEEIPLWHIPAIKIIVRMPMTP